MASAPNLDNFPADLKKLRRWVAWRYVNRGGKTTKKPLQSIIKPLAWLSVSEACDYVARGKAHGVGFVLGDDIVCIDLDNCIDEGGALYEIARDAVALRSYVERSPSGRGLHVLIRASIPRSRNIGARDGAPRHEIYDGRPGSARYITVTGDRFGDVSALGEGNEAQAAIGAFYAKWFSEESEHRAFSVEAATTEPRPLEDDEVLRIMLEATDGAKWRRLFEGDHSSYPSQSEADLALNRKFRFYSRADPAQMDRLFRRSDLMRAKWDERRGEQTYGERTISRAIAMGGHLYRRLVPRYRSGASPGQFGMLHLSVYPILSRLTKTDILTYGALAIHANNGECYPSAARIATLIGTTREHAQTSIGKLEAAGLISVEGRPGDTSTIRLLAFPGVSKFDTPRAKSEGAKSSPRPQRVGRSRTFGRGVKPVSGLDTPSVSNFDTQTDNEQTNKHRRERGAELENKSAPAEPDDSKRAADEKALSPLESCIPSGRSVGTLRRKPGPYDGWDVTANTAEGRELLWKYAKEKLGLMGRVVLGSGVFGSVHDPTQPEIGL